MSTGDCVCGHGRAEHRAHAVFTRCNRCRDCLRYRPIDEHEHCYQDFHRCDGGGKGEYDRYDSAKSEGG